MLDSSLYIPNRVISALPNNHKSEKALSLSAYTHAEKVYTTPPALLHDFCHTGLSRRASMHDGAAASVAIKDPRTLCH